MDTPELTIKCFFDPKDGSFGGMAFGRNGANLGPVTGTAPPFFFENETPRKAAGRPKELTKNIAVMAHVDMTRNATGSTLRKAQVIAADELCIGSSVNPEDQIRAVQRHISKAGKALPKKGLLLLYWPQPSNKTNTLLWFFFEAGTRIEVSKRMPNATSSVCLTGKGWVCRWAEKAARFGTVSLSINGQTDEGINQMTEMLSD